MPSKQFAGPLERVNECLWRIPKSYKRGMRVDGLIYADDALMELIRRDDAAEQVANVAFLPGIQRASLAMPDIHWGYGFCIGGVCAADPEEGGVISPGGVGYDINCGVRLMRSNLNETDVRPAIETLVRELFRCVPTGAGHGGKYKFDHHELRRLLELGPQFLQERGLATERDLEFTEGRGCLEGARPDFVSDRALDRGNDQGGTLGREDGLRDDSFRRARPRLPGLRRRAARFAGSARKIRHRAARPTVGLRASAQPRGAALSRRDAGGRKLRLGQPPTAHVAGAGSLRADLRADVGRAGARAGLRRGPQHRQVRG